MSLVPCRACGHQVDTSALACPRCGATDPAKKISRQQRNLRSALIQLAFWLTLLGLGSWYVMTTVIPMARQLLVKPQSEQGQTARP
jgi:hypothetical protein